MSWSPFEAFAKFSSYNYRGASCRGFGATQPTRNALDRLTSMCRAIVSLAVTVPSVYYLAQPQIERFQHPEKHGHGGHGGHDEHDEHGEEGGSGEEGDLGESEGPGDEEGKDQVEDGEEQSKEDEKDEVKSDESGTLDDGDPENTAHEKEGGQDVEGVQFKGATSGGTEEGEQGDTRKHIPDAKGFSKKRIESHYGGKEGEATNEEQDPSNKDLVPMTPPMTFLAQVVWLTPGIQAAASKPAGDKTTQSGKQEGLSNTDTKHSTNIAADPDKSTKGEGGPETAKNKGTVDPQRPQV